MAGADGLASFAHASDTLAVDLGWLGDIDRGLALLDEAVATARQVGRLDEVMRCYANRTTLLDRDSRREEALAVVKEGIAEASRSGLGLTYGAFLRGNAADILFQLGRWTESEAECRAATEFPPAGVAWFSPTLYLSLVLIESRADEEARPAWSARRCFSSRRCPRVSGRRSSCAPPSATPCGAQSWATPETLPSRVGSACSRRTTRPRSRTPPPPCSRHAPRPRSGAA